MGAIADLNNDEKIILDGNDSIVIRRVISMTIGGRTLDMTGFPDRNIRAGHVLIRETTTDTWKPMPVAGGKYASLPEGYEYKGVAVASQPAERPFVSNLYAGEVNDEAMPYPLTNEMRAALREALPQLVFTHD